MFQKHQTVTVTICGKPVTGSIVRPQGKTGFMVRVPGTRTIQDHTTGKITTFDVLRDAYFKTADIQPVALPTAA